jgi:hypothetical protein
VITRRDILQLTAQAALGAAAATKGPNNLAQQKEERQTSPVFVYDYGWFEAHGYECWNVAAMWRDVPEKLRPHSWLILYAPPERIYSSKGPNTGPTADIPPRPDPGYPRKDAALEKALSFADARGINVVLMVRRYVKSLAGAPSYARVERACKQHSCVKGFLFTELGGSSFTEVDAEHALRFTSIAKQHRKKVLWANFQGTKLSFWNFLMTDPQWRSFLPDHYDTIVPTWKNVEPCDNMLNWADCVGLWLSGVSANWGFMFDSCFWPQYLGAARRGFMGRRKIWESFYPKPVTMGGPPQFDARVGQTAFMSGGFHALTQSCPSYLVKDTMILAALTGCRWFQFERFKAFEPGGTLRPVRDKTASLILDRGLCRTADQVRERVELAVETPARQEDGFSLGFSHTFSRQKPNVLWKEVFNVAEGGLDLVPNEASHYLVPIIPPGMRSRGLFKRVLTAEEAAQPEVLRAALAQHHIQRFIASDPNVLVFDAGSFVYITDSREDDRTTLEFTLESRVQQDYRCTVLTQDATQCDVEVASEKTASGWRKPFFLVAGCSVLLEAESQATTEQKA